MAGINSKSARILVFSTEKISDPAIDMAGLLKLHYPPTVYTISIPCSSGVKSKWIFMHLKKDSTVYLLLPMEVIVRMVNHALKKQER